MAAFVSVKPYNGHLIVFDFDCTLTTKHFFHFMNSRQKILDDKIISYIDDMDKFKRHILENNISEKEKEIIIEQFFGGNYRFEKLKVTLQKLKEDGCHIIIASRGMREQIIALLTCVGLLDLFNEIYGHPTSKEFLLYGKMKEKACKYLYYFDDDKTENNKLIDIFKPDNEYKIGNPKENFNVLILSLNLNGKLFEVQYNFFNKLIKDKEGLTIQNLDYLLTTIENSIQESSALSPQPIMSSNSVLPVNGTTRFQGNVSKAIKYFISNPFILTAVYNNNKNSWYINSQDEPTFFTILETEPLAFSRSPEGWDISPESQSLNPNKNKYLKYGGSGTDHPSLDIYFTKYLKYKQKYLEVKK